MSTARIRIASYNIHKCRGLDYRSRPERVARVLAQLDADIIALQEVLSIPDGEPQHDQARFLAAELGYECSFGENRRLRGGAYGNATLSRLPITLSRNYDLSWRGRERRGCLRTDIKIGETVLHVFNVHLGTSFFERRHQARLLLGKQVLGSLRIAGPRIIAGDFNEWTRGLASRLMSSHFQSIDLRRYLRVRRTYPGIAPFLHLDGFYFDQQLALADFRVVRSRTTLVASDHLPLVAEFVYAA